MASTGSRGVAGAGPPPPAAPPALERAAAVAWRVLLIAVAVLALLWALSHVMLVVVPVAVALLAATVVGPPVGWMVRHGVHRLLATWIAMVSFLGLLIGAGLFVVPQMVSEFSDLGDAVSDGIDEVRTWLSDGPLDLSPAQIDRYQDQIGEELRSSAGAVAGGVMRGAVLAVEVVAGTLLALVLTFFFVKDSEQMTGWFLGLMPAHRRDAARRMGSAAWDALGAYIRGTAIVGLVDAVLIGLGLVIIGVPLVLPLALLTFIGAFFPLVGATVAGLAAALVALVTNGGVDALLVLGVVIVVQQVEGDVLAPLVVGRAVNLHPVVILLTLTVGGLLAGIVGAFLAVPVAATMTAAAGEWRRMRDDEPTAEARVA